MKLAIIVLNYRTPELTLECIASLESEVDSSMDVIVVDNASGDGSAERIEQGMSERGWNTWVRLLRSPVNGGFGAGNNFGIRATQADAYLLLNSDTLVRPGAIAALRDAMATRPDVGLIGPCLVDARGDQDQTFFRALRPITELLRAAHTGPLSRLLSSYDMLLPVPDEAIEADWLAFAAVLIRREVIEQIGPLDEGYFMYFEDVDYCRRAREAGWKVLYWPHTEMVHYKGASSRVTDDAELRRRAPRYYYESRSRYFKKFFGRRGLWLANGFWWLGRCISLPREVLGSSTPQHREREAFDIWIQATTPVEEGAAIREPMHSHIAPAPRGERNGNPPDLPLRDLLREDFETHDRRWGEPGFWAVALHRLGNARMDVEPKALRAPLSAAYRLAFNGVNWLWGIELPYSVRLGRRVRIWHHGGIVVNARAIGSDVHLRHNTTLDVARPDQLDQKPIIGDGVDIGVGSCILGPVTVGDGAVIGANSVVVRDIPEHCVAVGAPARAIDIKRAHEEGGDPARGRLRLRRLEGRAPASKAG
jgi:GT2 family glycosyltransferase/serine acetyltransferase